VITIGATISSLSVATVSVSFIPLKLTVPNCAGLSMYYAFALKVSIFITAVLEP
jgi:hypothetical protein